MYSFNSLPLSFLLLCQSCCSCQWFSFLDLLKYVIFFNLTPKFSEHKSFPINYLVKPSSEALGLTLHIRNNKPPKRCKVYISNENLLELHHFLITQSIFSFLSAKNVVKAKQEYELFVYFSYLFTAPFESEFEPIFVQFETRLWTY